jgi:hypothetical protein
MKTALKETTKFLKKNKSTVIKTIIPVVIFCLIVTIIGILSPKPNDNITPSNTYLFENRNLNFNVGFGNREYSDKSFVRFEAKVDNSNPFEEKDINLWDKVKGLFTTKKQGFEFGLTEVKFDDSQSETSKNIFANITEAVKEMEIDDVSTDTEVIEVGRLLGEENGDSMSKETVINKDVYPGIDVEYQILENLGVKEEIVIRDIDAYTSDCGGDQECLVPLNKFVFNLRLDEGTQLKKSLVQLRGKTDTKYYITDSDGKYIAHFLPTFAVDGVGSKTTDVDLDIYQVEGRNYKVEVILSLDWMFSSDRVFPIRIDPSIVHDTTTEFDTGSDYNTEVVTGPKVQLEEAEGDVVDSTVEGLWHMDKNVDNIVASGGTVTYDGNYVIHTFTNSGTFTINQAVNAEVLVVAGGGGGGAGINGYGGSGGGGAGGVIYNANYSISANSYSVTVGAGGAGRGSDYRGYSGENSVFSTLTAIGGGGGGATNDSRGEEDGANGGSGGGAGGSRGINGGTGSQGGDGGDSSDVYPYLGGGGGGYSEDGGDGGTGTGAGGDGIQTSIRGSSEYFAGGGAGGRGGTPGLGGGGEDYCGDATANTGGGGGGCSNTGGTIGGDGGSGIVIIRYFKSLLEDFADNNNDGTVYGATHTLEGKYHGAMYFDGTDDYIEVDNDSSLQLTNDFTIALWVYRTGEGGGTWPRILSKSSASGSFDYSVQVTETYGSIPEDHIMFAITKSDTNTHWVITNKPLEFNRWTHIVCTIDSSNNLKLYMDGEDVSGLTDGTVGAARSTTSNLQFGRLGDSGGWHYSYVGYLDEILIMSDAIGADDAKRLYTNGYESVVLGAHTSTSLNLTETSDVESITWTPVGDNTGDGETVYSTTNLIGQWNFNETSGTTADNEGSCGSSCDATLYNMTTTGQDAGVGTGWTEDNRKWGAGALMFDGSNDYASIADDGSMDFERTDSYTLSAWVKTQSTDRQIVVAKMTNSSPYQGFDMGIINGVVRTHVSASWDTSAIQVDGSRFIPDGKWHYIVVTYDGSSSASGIKIYVDGRLEDMTTNNNNLTTSIVQNAPVTIGARNSESDKYFNGVIDSVSVYSRALSSTEILSNYQSGNIEMRYRTSTDGSTWSSWSGDEEDIEGFANPYLYDNSNDDAGTGLVSYWQLDESTGTSVDDSFGSNDGTATGTTIVDAKYSKGRDFNGSSDYVNVSHSTSLNFERTDSFTLSAWVKTSSTEFQGIISKMENSSPYRGYDLSIHNNHLVFDIIGTWETSAIQKYSRTDITDGRWHHVAATYDGSSSADGINLYIDGYPDENPGVYVDNLTTTIQQTTNLRIGSRTGGGYFDGIIDEARVYNTELSKSAIYNEYQESLVSYWKLDETSGSTATDFIGTNDGTASGTTIVDAKYGKGRSFNGSSDYIDLGSTNEYALTTYTISGWFNTSYSSEFGIITNRETSETARSWWISIWKDSAGTHTDGSLVWRASIDGSWVNGVDLSTSSAVDDGNWHHFTAVLNSGKSATLYLDGEVEDTQELSGRIDTPSATTVLGKTSNDSTRYFNGKLDDFKIYNRALTETEIQNQHLVGYWSMEELSGSTVYDVTGDDHGTVSGAVIREGKHGNARWFDGVDDSISTTSTTSMEETDEFTISAWVYARSAPSESDLGRTVASKFDWVASDETYGWNFGAIHAPQFFQFHVSDGGHTNNQLIEDTAFFAEYLNNWVHMVGVFKSSEYLKLYRNGVLVDELTSGVSSTVPYTTNDPFRIGTRSDLSEGYWDGGIDEVRFYDKALSENTIKDLYLQGSTKPESLRTKSVDKNMEGTRALEIETDGPIIDGDTVGYWTLDETGGSSAYIKDSSGNQNGSTPYNTTYVKKGKIGGARDFNGTSSLIDVGWSSSPSNNFTLESWFTVDSTHEIDTESTTGAAGLTGQKYLFYPLYDSDGSVGVSVGTNGISVYEHSSSYLPAIAVYEADIPGGWNHLAVVYVDKTPHIYLNGVHVHTGLTSPRTNVYVKCDFGGDGGSGDYGYHDGMIDDIRISNISRSAEEILESYNLGKYRYNTKSISSADISDDSYLPFWIASEDLGHNLDLIYGNSPYANYQPDENTVGLWHMDENIFEEEGFSLSGGTESTDGDYTLYTFTSSGTLSVTGSGTIDVVTVGGGGGASYSVGTSSYSGAGGGGGGLGYRDDISVSSEDLTVTVGTGGDGGTSSSNDGGDGGDTYLQRSSTDLVKANGGDGGVSDGTTASGGSGGTTALAANDGGGNGGSGAQATSNGGGGGGGGAGGYSGNGGNGGVGNSGTGSNGSGGGGGGGGGQSTAGTQNNGGGGVGIPDEGTSGTGGAVNNPGTGGSGGNTGTSGGHGGGYGGGGGGAEDDTAGDGGDGADGVLVVKVLTSSLSGGNPTGGTITTDGDYTLHTFYPYGLYDFENTTFPPDSEWSTSGDANWSRNTSTYYEGSASAGSGDISDSQTTVLEWETTLAAAGTLSFYWSVSSESGYDYLVFCVDNPSCSSTSYDERISGTVSWTQINQSVTSGSHTFTWLYEKDTYTSSGSDMGWIDFIQYPVASTQTFTVPDDMMGTVDVVTVGGGGGGEQYTSGGSGGGGGGLSWMNDISLSGGDYSIGVGSGGNADTDIGATCNATDGGESYFINRYVVRGEGGGAASYDAGGVGGGFKVSGNGGNGGDGATSTTYAGGGGGAGGYSGDGGDGGDGDTSSSGSSGSGGAGGGGGGGGSDDYGGGGGGVDPYGSGTSGTGGSWTSGNGGGGGGGSGGEDGNTSGYSDGGLYGGGGGGADNGYGEVGDGGDGVVVVKYLTDSFQPEGNVKDSSGNGYDGLSDGTTYIEEAKLGGGRYFDGSDDYVVIAENDALDPSEITLEAWIKPTIYQSGNFVNKGDNSGYRFRVLGDGSIQFLDRGGTNALTSNSIVPLNSWSYVVAVGTSSGLKIYINGKLDASNSTSYGGPDTSSDLVLGRWIASSAEYYAGDLDEVRVSDVARTADEIRQAYEVGRRTHPITIDFRADLESSNLIGSSSDLSFTISEQDYGTTDHIENIDVGQTIIVKENYGGTEYFAQGELATVNTSTGAVTVSSWENGSTFPTSGFTANATVYKWQREYVDIRYPLDEDVNSISTLTFRKASDVGTKFWIDDTKRATYSSDYAGSSFTTIEGVQYVQYESIFSRWDDNRELDLYLSEVDIEYSSGPTMDQIMRHGKWFNSSGEKQPFWWVNN